MISRSRGEVLGVDDALLVEIAGFEGKPISLFWGGVSHFISFVVSQWLGLQVMVVGI